MRRTHGPSRSLSRPTCVDPGLRSGLTGLVNPSLLRTPLRPPHGVDSQCAWDAPLQELLFRNRVIPGIQPLRYPSRGKPCFSLAVSLNDPSPYRTRLAAVFAGGFAASVASADVPTRPSPPAPTQLSAQFVDESNIHLAENHGAINRRAQVTTTLSLRPDHTLVAEETGTRRESNLYENFTTQEQADWKNSWTGTWVSAGDKLMLELTLKTRHCERWKTYDSRSPKENLPCAKLSTSARLECRSEPVPIHNLDHKTPGPTTQLAWLCVLATEAAMGETRLPWVFGKSTCIRAVAFPFGGRRTYQLCQSAP